MNSYVCHCQQTVHTKQHVFFASYDCVGLLFTSLFRLPLNENCLYNCKSALLLPLNAIFSSSIPRQIKEQEGGNSKGYCLWLMFNLKSKELDPLSREAEEEAAKLRKRLQVTRARRRSWRIYLWLCMSSYKVYLKQHLALVM